MTCHHYSVNGLKFEADQIAEAREVAKKERARLIHHWDSIGGPQQDDESTDYPALKETATHIWVSSPIGEIGIPVYGRDRSEFPHVMAVSLRVLEFSSGLGIQANWISYVNGTHSGFSGQCFAAYELARRDAEVAP